MTKGYLFLSSDLKSYSLLTEENNNIEGKILPSMLYDLLALRIDNIYLWQGAALFALIDNFANKQQLFNYADIPTDAQGRRKKCDCEAISYKDGSGVYYQRKLWLKTAKADSTDRHKRLSATSFINFSNFFGGEDFGSVCDSFGVMPAEDNCSRLRELIAQFDYFIKEITGLKLLKENGGINYWTIGGLSKAFYLELYKKHYAPDYQGNILKLYQSYHMQNKEFEFDMRLAHLLTPGMLYYRDTEKRLGLFKYDINSLFPAVEQHAPFLGIPRKCEEPTAEDVATNKFEYIYLYSNLHLRLKEGMPAIFKHPEKVYKGENEKDIFIDNIAFFRAYHNNLLLFYDIVDYEKVEFYCMRKQDDLAIKEYVERLYNYKVGCKRGDYDLRHYPLIKYLLNNLHGKFAQLTIVEDYDYNRNSEGIITRKVKKLCDTWAQSHFDYLRGAWIYSQSQADMLAKIYWLYLELKKCTPYNGSNKLVDHVFYIDTDCIITDIEPYDMEISGFIIDPYELGAFKQEAHYIEFQAYAPKTYAGIVDGKLKLTAAGMKKQEILTHLINKNIPYSCCLDYLALYPYLPCTILKRTSEGCEYVTEWRPLGKGFNIADEEEGVLYDSDNFII